jgi:hypothetical protein
LWLSSLIGLIFAYPEGSWVNARKGRAAIADIYEIGPPPSNLVLFDRWIQMPWW